LLFSCLPVSCVKRQNDVSCFFTEVLLPLAFLYQS
jgi:hypothetical protein